MEVESFADLEAEFMERVSAVVWCNLATVDTTGRPRSRVVHPVWEGPVGWLGTRPGTLKEKHLAANPFVSLAYVADVAKPVYADCRAEWVESVAEKERVWQLFKATPPPLGYDPGTIWKAPDHPGFGLLRFTPWRIELSAFPAEPRIWRPS